MVRRTSYFAYGSNMNTEQMADRCPGHLFGGRAMLRRQRFIINSRGVATIVPEEDGEVWGIVWRITEADEKELDKNEGVRLDLYRKAFFSLLLDDGTPATVYAYIATERTPGSPRPGYMEKIVKSARSHGLPGEYVDELNSWVVTP
jgi:gamma-glutamylcyclotransferase (GGCT)/AIG2-like uncharacterized protein YtfP